MVRQLSGATPRSFSRFHCAGFAMNGDDKHGGREPGSQAAHDGDLSERFKRLETQLDGKRPPAARGGAGSGPSAPDPTALSRAFRMSTEFIAGVIAGGGLGWLLDRVAGTSPWGMIVLLMLGFGAGIYNVMRVSGFLAKPPAAGPKSDD